MENLTDLDFNGQEKNQKDLKIRGSLKFKLPPRHSESNGQEKENSSPNYFVVIPNPNNIEEISYGNLNKSRI